MKNKLRKNYTAIKAGDLLLTEQPFAFILSSKEKGSRCDNCLQKCRVLKCSGCQFVHYCGKVCQRDAWSDHKWECANLKRVSPKVIPDGARMLAKIINRIRRSDGGSYKAFYSATSFRMWKDLMSHYSDLKADKKRMDHFTSLCVVLFEFLKDISLPNTVDLMGLYGRMIINSFTILDMDMNSIGTGIYIAASIVDHSCNPNAVATFDGKTINIRAIKDMPYLDWKQIRISYIDLMKTPYERQMELLENYYFLCQCDRCMDENHMKYEHAAKCLNTKCDNPINIIWKEDLQLVKKATPIEQQNGGITNGLDVKMNGVIKSVCCDECGVMFTDKDVDTFVKSMEFSEMSLHNMKETSVAYLQLYIVPRKSKVNNKVLSSDENKYLFVLGNATIADVHCLLPDVDICKFCLERQEGVLHPLNVLYAQTLDNAFDALIQVQLWEQACVYAEKLLPCFRFYYGNYHPLVGLLHMKYGKILLYKIDLPGALHQFKCAEKIIKITHGEKHPLYRDHLLPAIDQAIIESV